MKVPLGNTKDNAELNEIKISKCVETIYLQPKSIFRYGYDIVQTTTD